MTRSILSASIASILLLGCASQPSPIEQASTHDGLQRVETREVDALYRRPGATLAGYQRILLEPIEVAFSKNWKPEQDTALYRMNPPDREKMKREIAELFQETFRQVLTEKGGYSIATEPAEDVVQLRAAIVNIYVNAPDVSMQTPGRTRTFTASAGEMTLIAELHDSVTGELISRAYDRREDQGTGTWTWTTSVTNTAEAKQEIRRWAELLKKALDTSRAKV